MQAATCLQALYAAACLCAGGLGIAAAVSLATAPLTPGIAQAQPMLAKAMDGNGAQPAPALLY